MIYYVLISILFTFFSTDSDLVVQEKLDVTNSFNIVDVTPVSCRQSVVCLSKILAKYSSMRLATARDMLNLSAVCQLWRDAALNTPHVVVDVQVAGESTLRRHTHTTGRNDVVRTRH